MASHTKNEHTKLNMKYYRNRRIEKAYKAKKEFRVRGIIYNMVEQDRSKKYITPYINMDHTWHDESDDEYDNSDSSESEIE